MPNLNVPVQPMMPYRDTGGVVKKIVIILVIALLGGGGYYLYKSGKLPFLKKAEPPPPPVEIFPPPDASTMKAMTPAPATTPPPSPTADKNPMAKADSRPTAMAPQPPMGRGDFTIVIASFQEKNTAEEEAARWSSAGFQSMVNEKALKAGTWYRVSLGRYETRQEAMKSAKEMEHMFESGFWIDRVQ